MLLASSIFVLASATKAGAFAADKVPLGVALAGANKPIPKPPATSGKWRLTLNVGREQGTPMPAEWASSGARMLMSLDVDVLESPADDPDLTLNTERVPFSECANILYHEVSLFLGIDS